MSFARHHHQHRLRTPSEPARHSRPLQWRLLTLCVAGLLPLVVAALATVAYVVYDRDTAMERNALMLARSIGASTQAELSAAVAALEVLTEARSLKEERLQVFESHARAVAQKRGWRTITLIDPMGRLLLSTDDPGARGQMAWERASVDMAIARRAPAVGLVVKGKLNAEAAFPIRVPVLQNGEVLYVLSAMVGADRILDLVKRQPLSAGHVVAIFDASGTRIARSVGHVSSRASPSLQALIDTGAREGEGQTRTLEGDSVHTAFHRTELGDWVIAVGVPAVQARNALLASLVTALAGLMGSLALSAWLAWYFARRVSQPISELKRAAEALGHNDHVDLAPIDIEELQGVGLALTHAAQERKLASAERESLLGRTMQALKQAEEASRTKDEFMAVLGHELRNPLAPITTALRLLSAKADGSMRAELRIIERQLAHMTRLVDDLLDVSRITQRQLAIHRTPVRIATVIEQVVEGAQRSLGSRQLSVVMSPPSADCWVAGDEVRLSQVLTNLLGNAVKFTSAHGQITLRTRRDDAWVRIDVADDGVGLTAEQAVQVFDLFYQAPQTLDRALGGLGLGLPIVRSLVEMHGGSIEVFSDGAGRGCTFTVTLPCIDPPPESATPIEESAPDPAAISLRIVVVDDNVDAADCTVALLAMSGHDARAAYTAEQALAVLENFDAQVALIDIGLPGMNGYELAGAIRQRHARRAIRLVALTGYGREGDVQRALVAGFHAHLTKPVAPELLLASITPESVLR